MRTLQPPLHLLRAFSTTARFGSISRAAESLHLTQSAVSKQVQELERLTGVALFERIRKRLSLTPSGQRYEAALKPILLQLEAATLELVTSAAGGGTLHLSSLPTFGSKWLIPRLPAFQKAHPQTALHFVPYVQGYDFQRPELDCSILFGDGHWPGAIAEYLTGRDIVLIVPPTERGRSKVRKPSDVRNYPLLHHVSVPNAWPHWLEAQNVTDVPPFAGPQFDQFHSLIRAVSAGLGVALVPLCLVQDDIANCSVARPFDDVFVDDLGYWLCYPERKAHLPTLVEFKAWILGKCA